MVESNGIEPFAGLRPDRSSGTYRSPSLDSRSCLLNDGYAWSIR